MNDFKLGPQDAMNMPHRKDQQDIDVEQNNVAAEVDYKKRGNNTIEE
jgi:hypothetical protein